jgi:hypothetical protein
LSLKLTHAIGQVIAALEAAGFTVDGMSPDGLAHRYIRPAKPQPVSRHLRDLALLCALVEEPFTLREEATKKDRSRLRMGGVLGSAAHPAWLLVPAEVREQGHMTFGILVSER